MALREAAVAEFLVGFLAGPEGPDALPVIGEDARRLASVWALELENDEQAGDLIETLRSLYAPLRLIGLGDRQRQIKLEGVRRMIRIMQRDAFVLESGNHAPHLSGLSMRISELKSCAMHEIRAIQPTGPDVQQLWQEYKMFLQSHLTVFGLESLDLE